MLIVPFSILPDAFTSSRADELPLPSHFSPLPPLGYFLLPSDLAHALLRCSCWNQFVRQTYRS